MKRFLFTFLAALCAISANAQIIKTLGYATNGQIVAATNVVWTNSFGFSTNTVAAQVRTNLLLGWSALTNTNATNFRASIGLGWAALTNTNAAEALLGYNTTNGEVVYTGTNTLTFTNSIEINPNNNDSMKFTVSQDAVSVFSGAAGENIVSLPADDVPVFSSTYYWNHPSVRSAFGFNTNLDTVWTATNSVNFRSAIGISLVAITNTSNVTLMRALSGSTNTNHPFSGSVSVVGTNNTNTLVFSNGILQEVQ